MDCPEITITTTEKAHPNIKFNLLDYYAYPGHGQVLSCCLGQLDFPEEQENFDSNLQRDVPISFNS